MATIQHGTTETADRRWRLLGWTWRRHLGTEEASGLLLADHPAMLAGLDRLGAAAVVVYEPPVEDVDPVLAVADQLRALAAFLDHRFGEDPARTGPTALAHEKSRELRGIVRDLEDWVTRKKRGGDESRRRRSRRPTPGRER